MDHNKLLKILKETGIPDHLASLQRNLYADQKAAVRTGHGTKDWFKIGKGIHQGYICHDSVEAAVDFISTTLTETDKKLEELLARSGSDSEASAHNAGDPGSIPGLERSPGEGNGNPLQYSCLEKSMDGGAWWATVHGVAKSQT